MEKIKDKKSENSNAEVLKKLIKTKSNKTKMSL